MKTRVLFGVGGVVSLLMALWGGVWGAGDAKARIVETQIARWELAGSLPADADPDGLADIALQAVVWDPLNPDYRMLVGKIHEWQGVARPVWSRAARLARDEAVGWYREAVALRPSDSMAWISIAQARFLNQRIDGETFGALERAGVFGPWEEVAQLKAAWVGMALWEHLPEPLQEAHNRSIQRMFMYHKLVYQVTVMAYQFGWLDELRALCDDPRAMEVIDRQVGWLEEGYHGKQE